MIQQRELNSQITSHRESEREHTHICTPHIYIYIYERERENDLSAQIRSVALPLPNMLPPLTPTNIPHTIPSIKRVHDVRSFIFCMSPSPSSVDWLCPSGSWINPSSVVVDSDPKCLSSTTSTLLRVKLHITPPTPVTNNKSAMAHPNGLLNRDGWIRGHKPHEKLTRMAKLAHMAVPTERPTRSMVKREKCVDRMSRNPATIPAMLRCSTSALHKWDGNSKYKSGKKGGTYYTQTHTHTHTHIHTHTQNGQNNRYTRTWKLGWN